MNEKPVLDLVTIVVGDMVAMAEFYGRLGVDLKGPDPDWPDIHRTGKAGIGFDLDATSFAPKWNAGWSEGRTGPLIGFSVSTREAVDEVYADLTGAGYEGAQEPFDAFWGARYAVVVDPEGNHVGLMSPIDPAHGSEAPSP